MVMLDHARPCWRCCSSSSGAARPTSRSCSGRSWCCGSSSLAVSGGFAIARQPQVLAALNPACGIAILDTHPLQALAIIGAVFLSLTGAEALYADMGHFGKTPVRIAWFALVLPSLLLNYYGQGALFLEAGPGRGAAAVRDGADAGAAVHDHPRHGGDGDRVPGRSSRARSRWHARPCSSTCCRDCASCRPRPRSRADLRAVGERRCCSSRWSRSCWVSRTRMRCRPRTVLR